jgi:SAM-dependent methyltransferase
VNGRVELHRADILKPLVGLFDLAWCFGVVHHTGDTFGAIWNIIQVVKPGGYLFLMVYGWPTDEKGKAEVKRYETIRDTVASLPYSAKIEYLRSIGIPEDKLHGWFDATTPKINDLYHYDEIESFLSKNGFTDIKDTSDGNRNIRIIGRKQ